MRVSVVLEHRFNRSADGSVWTKTQFPYEFWERYLRVFEEVNVVARAAINSSRSEGWLRVDGPGVAFSAVPHYIGPREYLRRRSEVKRSCLGAVKARDALICRLGSVLASHLLSDFWKCGRPYGVEVVSNPYDAFAPGAIRHPLRPFFRWFFPRRMQMACARACAGAYVTRETLQRRYPPQPAAAHFRVSDVMIPVNDYRSCSRVFEAAPRPMRLVFVGSLAQPYKGVHILLDALASAVRLNLDVRLNIVGDGRERMRLEKQAQSLAVADRVHFAGELPAGDAVRRALDESDIFVLPSLTEGLPRAMIEAMARGVPCLGTRVGGIPELIGARELLEPGDAGCLANKISDLYEDPRRLTVLSRENLERARDYQAGKLLDEWVHFWEAVRENTACWLATHGS